MSIDRPVALAALLKVALSIAGCRFDDSKLQDPPGGGRTFEELCASPEVVFCDDFEDGLDDRWVATEGVAEVEGGALTLPSWEGLPDSKAFLVVEPLEEAWLRFDVSYPEGFQGLGTGIGPLLFGGSSAPPYGMTGNTGVRPTGSDYFVTQLRPGDGGDAVALAFEGSFVNMSGNFPNSLVPDGAEPLSMSLGQWHCVEVGLRMNAPGSEDGTVELRVDGVGLPPSTGIAWRTDDALAVDTAVFISYDSEGDGVPTESSPNVIRIDDVAIGRAPLGCVAR